MELDGFLKGPDTAKKDAEDYVTFYNEGWPAYSLGCMAPKQYRETYESKKREQKD